MMRSSWRGFFALSAAFALCGIGTAYGQYAYVVGPSSSGEIITGSGTLLGPLSQTTSPVALSTGGSDSVTIESGGFATASGTDTIVFITSNDTLLNSGTISGGAGYNAVTFLTSTNAILTGESITNYGLITVTGTGSITSDFAGNTGANQWGNNLEVAVNITSGTTIGTITLSNTGSIIGGSIDSITTAPSSQTHVGNNNNYYDVGANVAMGVAIDSGSGIGTITLSNTGIIIGGTIGSITTGSDGGAYVGYNNNFYDVGANVAGGVDVSSGSGIATVTLSNTGVIIGGTIGSITGTNSGYINVGFNAGTGDTGGNVAVGVAVSSGTGITTLTLSNSGTISGGSITTITGSGGNVQIGYSDNYYDTGMNVADGVAITSGSSIGTGTFFNSGTITGGSVGSISALADGNVSVDSTAGAAVNEVGSNVAVGVAITSGSGIGTGTFSNTGLVAGGSIGSILSGAGSNVYIGYNSDTDNAGANVVVGFDVTSGTTIGTIFLTNSGTTAGGSITTISGSGGGITIGDNSFIHEAGANVAGGADVTSGSSIGTVTLSNTGVIKGGTFGSISSTAGGVSLGSNVSTNDAGANVAVGYDVTSLVTTGTVAITNPGAITGGTFGSITSGSAGTVSVGFNGAFNASKDVGANVAGGVDITSGNDIESVTVTNPGTIAGGAINSIFSGSNGAVYVGSNASTGGGDVGANVVGGLDITSGSDIGTVTISGTGRIAGGTIGSIISGPDGNVYVGRDGGANNAGGDVTVGIDVTSGIVIGTVTLSNTGTISGGSITTVSGSGGTADVGWNGGSDTGGNVAVGVAITSGSGITLGALSNVGIITGGTIGTIVSSGGGNVLLGANTGADDTGGNVAVGVGVTSGTGITTLTLSNSGTITGGVIGSISGLSTGNTYVGYNTGANDTGGNVAVGVDISSGSGIGTLTLSNTGVIIGGSITSISGSGGDANVGYSADYYVVGGNVAVGVAVSSGSWIGTGTFSNSGTIDGGNITAISGSGGSVYVGDNNSVGEVGGNVAVGVALTSGSGIGTGTFSNTGAITGGSIGSIISLTDANIYVGYNNDTSETGGNVAVAFDLTSGTSIGTLSLTNSGTITGGAITTISGSHGNIYVGGNFYIGEEGANVAVGVDVTSGSGISSVTLSNTGVITGGTIGAITSTNGNVYVGANDSSVDAGGNVAVGLDVTSGTSIGTVAITNSRTITGGGIGTITGAPGGQTYVGTNYGTGFGSQDVGANVAGALDITSGNGIDSVTLDNVGSIAGGTIGGISASNTSSEVGVGYNNGANSAGGNVASGFDVTSGSGINTLTLVNSGAITGGQLGALLGPGAASVFVGYNGAANDTGGNLAVGLAVTSGSWIGTGSISNLSGTIAGGGIAGITGTSTGSVYAAYNAGTNDAGGNVTTGIAITSGSGIGTFTLSNEGMITGGTIGGINGFHNSGVSVGYDGASNDAGGNVGVGLAITSANTTGTFAVTNSGAITGGNISSITGTDGATVNVGFNSVANGVGGNVTTGLAITSGSGIGTFSLVNSGAITGGTIAGINGPDFAAVDVGYNNQSNDVGGNVGVGLAITSGSTIGTVTLSNTGSITGGAITTISGSGGTVYVGDNASPFAAGANVATAVSISSASGIGTVTLSNTGSITGGSIGSITAANVGYNAGATDAGGSVAVGLNVSAVGAIGNLTVVNSGSITGGSIGTVDNASTLGANAAAAIVINSAFNAGGNLSVTNYGSITGGNVTSGAPAGYGIVSNAGQLVINNYGVISAGNGAAEAGLTPGYPAAAVSVTGNNNTINLDGHSSVNGTLQGAGTNNALNLNFTGVSPAELATLKSQLTNQGWTQGASFSGTFSLRGVTYYVDPLNVYLEVVANGGTPGAGISSYEGQALTPNQFAIGVSLDSLAYNPAPGTPLFALLNAIDASHAVPQALEALSPQGYEIYGELAIAYANELALSVDRRLNNLRDGSESIDTGGFGGSGGQTTAGYSKEDGKNIVQPSEPEKRWGFFASGLGMLYRGDAHDADVQQNGKSDSAGAIMGVDGKAGANAVIGGLVAYNSAGTTFGTEASTANIQSYTAGLYGSWHDGGFYVNTLAAYTRNNYSSTRNIVFPGFDSAAYGSTRGNQATLNVDGGYNWHVSDCLTLGPLVGLQYVNLGVDGFNELGGTAANLAVGRQEVNSLQSRLGVRADYHTEIQKNVAFGAELSAEWQHEYLDNARGIGADFIGSGLNSFSVETQSPQRDAAVLSTGVNFTFHDRLTLFSDYSLLIWNTSSIEQNFSAGLKISF